MIMDAYVRAGCDLQLGTSVPSLDARRTPTAIPEASPPPPSSVELRELWTTSVQVLAIAAMFLVSVMVGAVAGAAQAVGGPDVAARSARGRVVAIAQEMRAPMTVEEVAQMRAETERTLATVQAGLGPISVW